MTDGPGASQCCCSSSSMEELCSFPNEEKFTAVWQHSHRPSYRVPFWEGEQGEQSPQGAAPADHRGQRGRAGHCYVCYGSVTRYRSYFCSATRYIRGCFKEISCLYGQRLLGDNEQRCSMLVGRKAGQQSATGPRRCRAGTALSAGTEKPGFQRARLRVSRVQTRTRQQPAT